VSLDSGDNATLKVTQTAGMLPATNSGPILYFSQ
jgi:hypothetical protein